MAKDPQERERILSWVRYSAQARAAVDHHGRGLKDKLDVRTRLKGSMKNHIGGWLGGSALAGLAASRFIRRGPKVRVVGQKASWFWMLINLIKPIAKVWMMAQIKNAVENQTRAVETNVTVLKPSPFRRFLPR